MEPRKKDFMDYLVPILIIALVLFVSLHMAMANEIAIRTPSERGTYNLEAFFEAFSTQIETKPFEVEWCASSGKFLAVAGFICLLGVAYVYTERKKLINGKEYGTSEWGTPKQIAHLSAKRILASTIKEIKKSKSKKKKKEIEEAKVKYSDNSNIIFTQTEKICMYNFELNNNTMIIGGSGSGKTRGYVLPNLLQGTKSNYSPSFVVTDPKGEILMKIGKYLTEQGYVIKVLNLKEQNRSFCFNPFRYILHHKYEEQISNIVSSIMDSNNDKKTSNKEPFWEDMAKVLLKSLFYATYQSFPQDEQNMTTVMQLFRWFEVTDQDDRIKNPTKLDMFFSRFGDRYGVWDVSEKIIEFYKRYYAEVKEATGISSQFEQIFVVTKMSEFIAIPIGSERDESINRIQQEIMTLATLAQDREIGGAGFQELSISVLEAITQYKEARKTNYDGYKKPIGVVMYEKYGDVNTNPALRNWEDFRTKCKGKTAQSVISTALSKLAPFDEEQIRRIFSKDEMELDLVGERKTALFVVLPPIAKTYNFVANVLYRTLFEQLEYCATVKHNQTLPVPVRFILDEFYNSGVLPNFENILSYARSFGIGISIILQSLDQIKEMYEKSWGTILDNCSTFLYLGGIRHADTLDYISKLLGKGTFDKKTYSRTKGRQSSSNTNFDKIGRELLDASEIQRLKKNKCLLFVSGYQPYISRKFNYKTHKNYKFTFDANKKNIFEYSLPVPVAEKKKKVNHREEVIEEKTALSQDIITIPRVEEEPIVANFNTEENVRNLSHVILNMALASNEDVALSTDEAEEMALIAQFLMEEQEQEAEIAEVIKNIAEEKPISVIEDESLIKSTMEEMIDDKENLAIDVIEDDLSDEEYEEYVQTEEYEEFIDDLSELDEVEETLNDLINDDFIKSLNELNTENLFVGEVEESEGEDEN